MHYKSALYYPSIFRHMMLWGLFILYKLWADCWQDGDVFQFSFEQALLSYLILMVVIVYINIYVLMPLYYDQEKYILYAGSVLLLLFTAALLQRYINYAFWVPRDALYRPDNYHLENKGFWIPVRLLRTAGDYLAILLTTTLLKLAHDAYQHLKKLRELEKEKFAAELHLLKAQVNPHFFFNTLHTIYALTLKGSNKASKVVLDLSEMMHYMLYEANAEKVFVEDEISHIKSYIAIEEIRFRERLKLKFECSGETQSRLIAPILLLPFVENAFKHGLTETSGWIDIGIELKEESLHLRVANSCRKHKIAGKPGIGLSNVNRRLELLYPGKYLLNIMPEEDVFTVDLKLTL